MVSKILMIALIFGTASAATWNAFPSEKPAELAHKEGCYIEEINDVIPFGKSVSLPGQCSSIFCDKSLVQGETCGVVGYSPNCQVTKEDLSKPYPDCCPTIKCD